MLHRIKNKAYHVRILVDSDLLRQAGRSLFDCGVIFIFYMKKTSA
ncbi:MAG: hypothetical protein CENE_02069 [Candidatus Celerinatantimonas neptuna]|nr:MAG: hypothetical protein CENE_02069 [Candidatus Celerinatantimonas neptuna]